MMASESENNQMINLKSSDDSVFSVKYNIAIRSNLIKEMLEDNELIIADDSPIPLTNVDGKTLEKVVEWLNHHENDPIVEEEDDDEVIERRTYDISEWDSKFFEVDQCSLFKIILAANFMDIKPLLDVSCKIVANMIKGKTPEEIKKTFHLSHSFTKEEIEQIKKENQWCENSD